MMVFRHRRDVSQVLRVRKWRGLEWGAETGLFKHPYRNQQENYFGSMKHRALYAKRFLNHTLQEGNSVSDNLTRKKSGLLLVMGIDFSKILPV